MSSFSHFENFQNNYVDFKKIIKYNKERRDKCIWLKALTILDFFLKGTAKPILEYFQCVVKASYQRKVVKQMTLYDKIKACCTASNTTISAVEQIAGLGQGTISRWRKASPSIDNLVAVADVLGIKSIDSLLSGVTFPRRKGKT